MRAALSRLVELACGPAMVVTWGPWQLSHWMPASCPSPGTASSAAQLPGWSLAGSFHPVAAWTSSKPPFFALGS